MWEFNPPRHPRTPTTRRFARLAVPAVLAIIGSTAHAGFPSHPASSQASFQKVPSQDTLATTHSSKNKGRPCQFVPRAVPSRDRPLSTETRVPQRNLCQYDQNTPGLTTLAILPAPSPATLSYPILPPTITSPQPAHRKPQPHDLHRQSVQKKRQREQRRIRSCLASGNGNDTRNIDTGAPYAPASVASAIDAVLNDDDTPAPEYRWNPKAARKARRERHGQSPSPYLSPMYIDDAYYPDRARPMTTLSPPLHSPPTCVPSLVHHDDVDCYRPNSPRFLASSPPPTAHLSAPPAPFNTTPHVPNPSPSHPAGHHLQPYIVDPTRRNLGAPHGVAARDQPGRSQFQDPAPFCLDAPAPSFPHGHWRELGAAMNQRGWPLNARGMDCVFAAVMDDEFFYQLVKNAWVETEHWGEYARGLMKPFLQRWKYYRCRCSLWVNSGASREGLTTVGVRFIKGRH